MVNFNNYNSTSRMPSVHYGRRNVAARFENQAAGKAMAHLAYSQPDVMFIQYQQPQCHMSGFQKFMTGIQSFFGGFGIGAGITSGNMSPMNSMAQMGGMGMCNGMGMGMGNCMSMQGSLFGNRSMWC